MGFSKNGLFIADARLSEPRPGFYLPDLAVTTREVSPEKCLGLVEGKMDVRIIYVAYTPAGCGE